MKFCSGEEVASLAKGLISEKHQVHSYGLDLTVGRISAVKKEGDLDFGGSEEKEPLTEELKPVKRNPDDEYGWWNLTAGEYIVKFNETVEVPENSLCVLQPLLRTMKAGVMHPTLLLMSGEKIDEVVLLVGKSGLNIKENARISSLMRIEALKS
jgi:deoxycytidine triphosphate deaminase